MSGIVMEKIGFTCLKSWGSAGFTPLRQDIHLFHKNATMQLIERASGYVVNISNILPFSDEWSVLRDSYIKVEV